MREWYAFCNLWLAMETRGGFPLPLSIVIALLVLVSILVSVPAFPATYEVSPAGNDADAGDASAPWRTIQHAASSVSPGDIVIVRQGTYTESVGLTRSGTDLAPIAFTFDPGAVMVSPDPSASLEAFDFLPGTAYITVSGVEATGGFDETIFLRTGVHDVRIESCNLHNNHAGIVMGDASNITVDQCLIHENATLGIRIAGTTHDVLVSDTDSFSNGTTPGCSSTVDGFTTEAGSSGVTFVRARAYDNAGDGFDVQGDNAVLDSIESSDNACTGVKLWRNTVVRGCLVTGNARGIAITSLTGSTASDVANCTVAANNGVGIDLTRPQTTGVTYTVQIRNSIVSGAFKAVQYVSAALLSESHNIFFRPTPYDPVLDRVAGRRVTGHDINVGRWALRSHQGAGTLAVDPLFVDPINGDFHVAADSAAAGRGIDVNPAPSTAGSSSNLGVYQQPIGAANHAPFADAGRDRRGRRNRNLRFKGLGSVDPDGDPLQYSWDFGDGSAPVVGYSVTHAFVSPGIYTVTLTASDGSLTGSTSIHVTIS